MDMPTSTQDRTIPLSTHSLGCTTHNIHMSSSPHSLLKDSHKDSRKSSISFRAPHLSEFYRFVSGSSSSNKQSSSQQPDTTTSSTAQNGASNRLSHTIQLHSVSSTASNTNNINNNSSSNPPNGRRLSSSTIGTDISLSPSILDLPMIISNKDKLEYEDVLAKLAVASEKYSGALTTVSKAASEFGSALESLARLKGSDTQTNDLMSCSGLHFLISNHQQVLASSVEKNFQKSLGSIMLNFKSKTHKNDVIFNKELKSRIKYLKNLESVNYRIAKSKKRNLITYKETLKKINDQIDSIDALKYNYYGSLSRLIQDTNDKIIKNCSTIAKAEFEIYENIARKGWSGGGMDTLLINCPDPFGDETETETIFGSDDDYNDDNEEKAFNGNRSGRFAAQSFDHQYQNTSSSAIASRQRPDDNPFYTKISTTKSVNKKPQLINTKDALSIESDLLSINGKSRLLSGNRRDISPISLTGSSQIFSPNYSISKNNHESAHSLANTESSSPNANSLDAEVSTVGKNHKDKEKNDDNQSAIHHDVHEDDIRETSSPNRPPHDNDDDNNNNAKAQNNDSHSDDEHDDNNDEGEDEDDNSFSLPLPTNYSHTGLLNQPIFNNAWNDWSGIAPLKAFTLCLLISSLLGVFSSFAIWLFL